jgi:hypothetical protein
VIHRKSRRYSFGGSGGDPRTLVVPPGYKLLGFYGGIGGHLHNLGIVVARVYGTGCEAEDRAAIDASFNAQVCSSGGEKVPVTLTDLISLHEQASLQSFTGGST